MLYDWLVNVNWWLEAPESRFKKKKGEKEFNKKIVNSLTERWGWDILLGGLLRFLMLLLFPLLPNVAMQFKWNVIELVARWTLVNMLASNVEIGPILDFYVKILVLWSKSCLFMSKFLFKKRKIIQILVSMRCSVTILNLNVKMLGFDVKILVVGGKFRQKVAFLGPNFCLKSEKLSKFWFQGEVPSQFWM